jgi:hypothetical protein
MGKTTDKHTANLATLRQNCETIVTQIAGFYETRKPLVVEANKQIAIMDQVADKYMPGGVQTEGCEERTEKDPAYVKAASALDPINGKIIAVDSNLRQAKVNLKAAAQLLKNENTAFTTYVNAKKAKWFVGKKSVPAAEACIKATNDYILKCTSIWV